MLEASLSSTAVNYYRRPWQLFRTFYSERLQFTKGPIFPISTDSLALFIAFLVERKYAASTVLTYISALGFPHRLASLPDPTKVDMIQLALRGYSKLNPSHDSRLTISLPVLENIISACEHTQQLLYGRKLLQAMFAIAFFAALKVGEITCRPNQPHIFVNQVVFMKDKAGSASAVKQGRS